MATARPIIEAVSKRLGIDTDVLMHLFGECLSEVITHAESQGTCTIRGLGRFSQVPIETTWFGKPSALEMQTVFERAKYISAVRTFKTPSRKALRELKASQRQSRNFQPAHSENPNISGK